MPEPFGVAASPMGDDLIAVAAPVASLLGYVNLARYLLENLVWTALGLAGFVIVRRLIGEAVDRLVLVEGAHRGPLARMFALKAGSSQTLAFWLMLADSYHVSRYNTSTRRLTPAMFEAVVEALVQRLAVPA